MRSNEVGLAMGRQFGRIVIFLWSLLPLSRGFLVCLQKRPIDHIIEPHLRNVWQSLGINISFSQELPPAQDLQFISIHSAIGDVESLL